MIDSSILKNELKKAKYKSFLQERFDTDLTALLNTVDESIRVPKAYVTIDEFVKSFIQEIEEAVSHKDSVIRSKWQARMTFILPNLTGLSYTSAVMQQMIQELIQDGLLRDRVYFEGTDKEISLSKEDQLILATTDAGTPAIKLFGRPVDVNEVSDALNPSEEEGRLFDEARRAADKAARDAGEAKLAEVSNGDN